MSDLLDLQHQEENIEIKGDPTIGSMEPGFWGDAKTEQPMVALQELGHISAPFGDVVNPNAPGVLSQTENSGKAFIFSGPVTGREIAKAGTHNASTWAVVQTTLAA